MFSFDVLGICFERVRGSLLLLISCYFLVLVFGKEPSFGPTCLLCLHSLDSLSFLFVFVLFLVFLLVWGFSGFCSFCSPPHLEFVFSSLLCGRACFSTACLDCSSLCLAFLGCLFTGTLSGGRLKMADREGSIYFFGFFVHSRVFG